MSVIIVGGGMAGTTLALAISRLSHGALPVHLIEATAPESHAHPGFDGRAIALAAGTCQQLARIGVWQSLADCATAITTVHVSDRGHAGFVTLAAVLVPIVVIQRTAICYSLHWHSVKLLL